MAKNIKIKPSNFVGVNTSSKKTFGLKTNLTIQPSKLLTLRKALAFTLAEVLVVLGIIGVVSALTLPNLSQNTGNKETVAKLQKVQSELNDALGRAQAEYGPVKTWFRGGNYEGVAIRTRFNGRIEEFLRVSKTCEANKSGCFTNKSPKNFRGAETATV